jgi:hypothetical protein
LHSSIAARTDCAKKISIFVTLILCLARSRALFGPLKDQTVLLSDPHLVLEPDLDHHPEDQSLRSFAAPRIKS